jgi:hypothetical protein
MLLTVRMAGSEESEPPDTSLKISISDRVEL